MAGPSRTPRTALLLAAHALAALLAGCSGVSITLAVPSITIPADSTAGMVCYAKGEAARSPQIRTATYRADATYRSDGALLQPSNEVDVRVYGRGSAPASTCVSAGAEDVILGGPFTLVLDEPRQVVVGEGPAAETLAQLVNGGDYWIGVALETGFSLGGEQSIAFDAGRVTVTF